MSEASRNFSGSRNYFLKIAAGLSYETPRPYIDVVTFMCLPSRHRPLNWYLSTRGHWESNRKSYLI